MDGWRRRCSPPGVHGSFFAVLAAAAAAPVQAGDHRFTKFPACQVPHVIAPALSSWKVVAHHHTGQLNSDLFP